MGKYKKVTLSEIAAEANVSQPVVTAILGRTNKSSVRFSDATYERVMNVVRELNYRPKNKRKSNTSRGISYIALIYSEGTKVDGELIDSVVEEARTLGISISLEKVAEGATVLNVLKDSHVDGVVLLSDISKEVLYELQVLSVPYIYATDFNSDENNYINKDEDDAVQRMISIFVAKGKKRLAVVYDSENGTDKIRTELLKTSAVDNGMEPPVVYNLKPNDVDYDVEKLSAKIGSFLKKNNTIDCLVVSDDSLAAAVYNGCSANDISIPADISVVGFGNNTEAEYANPPLTSFYINPAKRGKVIVTFMNEFIIAGVDYRSEVPVKVRYDIAGRASV